MDKFYLPLDNYKDQLVKKTQFSQNYTKVRNPYPNAWPYSRLNPNWPETQVFQLPIRFHLNYASFTWRLRVHCPDKSQIAINRTDEMF